MDFINTTPFPATLARTILVYRDLMLANVIVKCGFQVSPSGDVSAVADQPAVQEEDIVTPFGTIDGDIAPFKQGCDFTVMGNARPYPPDRTVPELSIQLRVGEFARRWRVFGNRRWQRTDRGFEATAPEPFAEMPLSYDRAYGGSAIYSGRLKTYCFENRGGKGFVEREQDVDGLELPNLERADELVRSWRDRPVPAGLAPLPRDSALRGARGFRVDTAAGTTVVEPAAFCFSHPSMLLPAYPAGERFELTGMGRRESLTFMLPSIEMSVQVQLGARQHDLSLVPDTLCVFPDYARFYVIARRAFVYQFIPERRREVTLNARPPATPPPSLTIRAARQDRRCEVPIAPVDEELAGVFDDALRLVPMTEMLESLALCASG